MRILIIIDIDRLKVKKTNPLMYDV